ncbi:arsenic resistance protein [Aurantimonas aggregata]|uniref:Arsenic resistance protein n=1 Tax=Aurantimonas aggregata TaxID=2047720 RepID=A0A6L9MKW9_9HYPH|nr:arsenic resistance protein [Aurantimonas aggregata]
MTRQQLERHQVWLYLAAIITGLGAGTAAPAVAPFLETTLWPALGFLLYTTFTQVPLTGISRGFRDGRFIGAVLAGNFVLIPLLVWSLLLVVPDDPAIRLGVVLVLLMPCTDWYVTFTHLGGGDTPRAIAVTPVNLILQLLLLPAYLWLFMGETFLDLLAADRIATVFATLLLLPLLAAWLTEVWAGRKASRAGRIAATGWLPVPLLALVLFMIAASQVDAVFAATPVLGQVLGAFLAFLVAALLIGLALGRLARLSAPASRALIFSLGTRNSFLVLPLALALAPQWQTATVVIVFQSLVELFGMLVYLWLVPQLVPAPNG